MNSQPANMFPSMSVNVSMNMTMGMPGMTGMSYNMDQCSAPQHQVTWNTGQAPAHPTANMAYASGQSPSKYLETLGETTLFLKLDHNYNK